MAINSCKGRQTPPKVHQADTFSVWESQRLFKQKQIRILECVLIYFSDTILFKAGIKIHCLKYTVEYNFTFSSN